MATTTDPSNTWRRLAVEVWRLSNWAKRHGTEQHKDAVQELIASLNKLAPNFEFFSFPADKYARSTRNDPPASPPPVNQPDPGDAYHQGVAAAFAGASLTDNPFNLATHPEHNDYWDAGYKSVRGT